MLFEAFFWDTTADRPPFVSFCQNPEFVKLHSAWGRPGDVGLIAEENNARLGAAWFRTWSEEIHSYGFVDANTPELGIAVHPAHRGKGTGRALMTELIRRARANKFSALSLSVNPINPARSLYESLGFRKVGESGTSWTLRLDLD
jgi:ribosomal protein S18 acetylase RimI-like enzyme